MPPKKPQKTKCSSPPESKTFIANKKVKTDHQPGSEFIISQSLQNLNLELVPNAPKSHSPPQQLESALNVPHFANQEIVQSEFQKILQSAKNSYFYSKENSICEQKLFVMK